LAYEKGNQIIQIDSLSFLGGNGNRLGQMSYCIAGITSCFIATFVSVASSQGIKINKLNVNSECIINFAKTFDVADEPITEGIDFQLDIQSDISYRQKHESMLRMAEARCPAIYSMSNIIKFNAKIK
jgi:uncharacterized OsmC-like protein